MLDANELDAFFASHRWSPVTQDTYKRLLLRLFQEVPTGTLKDWSPADFQRWLEGHDTWGESMKWLAYLATRHYLRWKFGASHPALLYKFRRYERGKPQRTLTAEDVTRLLNAIDPDTLPGKRNLALVYLLLDTGLRASEICRLSLQYLDVEQRTFQVLAKGGQWRIGVFSQATQEAMRAWLQVRDEVAAEGIKNVFVAVGGLKPGRPLTREGLRVILLKLGQKAGIKVTTHDFRRTFATLSLRAGAPSRLVQVAGGWNSLEMVERYSRAIVPQDFQRYFPTEYVLKQKPQ